jgi:hypothetical protein
VQVGRRQSALESARASRARERIANSVNWDLAHVGQESLGRAAASKATAAVTSPPPPGPAIALVVIVAVPRTRAVTSVRILLSPVATPRISS